MPDLVADDYVEFSVATGNSHPRTPAFGAEMVSTVATLTSDPRWSVVEEREVDDVE